MDGDRLMANQIPLFAPGDPGYVSPERWREMSDRPVRRVRWSMDSFGVGTSFDSEASLREQYLSGDIEADEFERRIGKVLERSMTDA